jgi:hypothetical protein
LKRRRLGVQLGEEQLVIFAVVLVILVAVSMLYCLGIAMLALHEGWESAPIPWNDTDLPVEEIETLPNLPLLEPDPFAAAPS